ncbi:Transducin/WD40 repeat-like superfamily protein [Striga hermonthica]|uniref:Transducin/WD40 repeat-like superfamily protein n=1 Tax=Striga hermonthica TaxID=68872 RepID=A0A9N7RR70_STRHE|nr:Transducin/WD40 repeat-like superfamily protein [Striga hermonthica]
MLDIQHTPCNSNFSAYDLNRLSCEGSPIMMSPGTSPLSPRPNGLSPTTHPRLSQTGLIGSLKDLSEFAAFKSNSGLVKAIIISGDRLFTGHQDGKVRVWRAPTHKRIGTMPNFFDIFKASIRPRLKNRKDLLPVKHADAISCLSIDHDRRFLDSASWDRTSNRRGRVHGLRGRESEGVAEGGQKWGEGEARVHADAAESGVCSDGAGGEWGRVGGLHWVFGRAGELLGADIYVWMREGAVHTCLSVLTGHNWSVKCLAVEKDTEMKWVLYNGSLDKSVKVWSMSETAPNIGRMGVVQGDFNWDSIPSAMY